MEEGPETADAVVTRASPCPADHPARPAASMLTVHRKMEARKRRWRRKLLNSSAIELKGISEFNNHVCHSLKNIHCKDRLKNIFSVVVIFSTFCKIN